MLVRVDEALERFLKAWMTRLVVRLPLFTTILVSSKLITVADVKWCVLTNPVSSVRKPLTFSIICAPTRLPTSALQERARR